MSEAASSMPKDIEAALAGAERADALRRIPVNLYETDEALGAVAAMPAVMADDIEVELVGGRLSLRARLRTAAPKNYLLQEWAYGDYERTLPLPRAIGADPTATYGNGQLVVRLPLSGEPHDGPVPVTQAG